MKFSFVTAMVSILICIMISDASGREILIPRRIDKSPVDFIRGAMLARDGTIWVVGDRKGVYRMQPGSTYNGEWFNMNYYTGFPPTATDFTCVAQDNQGRVWVGTHKNGVAVFNGREWKTYDISNALPGNHVYSIAVSTVDGAVAIATSHGVVIYNPSLEKWTTRTRANGLLENQVEGLTFDQKGRIWLAYGCGGVSTGSPRSDYMTWEHVQAKWYWDTSQAQRYSFKASGVGLPSNMCNSIYYSRSEDRMFVCTTSGLGYSNNMGRWQFLRGADFAEKNNGVYGSRERRTNTPNLDYLIPEDFTTCFTETEQHYYIGTREQGAARINKKNLRVTCRYTGDKNNPMPSKWITSLIPLPDGTVIAATYGGGLILIERGRGKFNLEQADGNKQEFPSLPPLKEPNEISQKLASSKLSSPLASVSPIIFGNEDWETQGDWCEKYGRDHAVLCSMIKASNFVMDMMTNIKIRGSIGANRKQDDQLRHWIFWPHVELNDNRNVLYCPAICFRKESEWDDQGEAYSRTFDGPDVWAIIELPEGRHEVSFYFYNPNGYNEAERHRDYFIEARKYDLFMYDSQKNLTENYKQFQKNIWQESDKLTQNIQKLPVLARARVRYFATGGVYKTFICNKPGKYFFRICRNNSFNTILNGIFVSQLSRNNRKESEFLHSFLEYGYHPPSPLALDEIEKKDPYYSLITSINNHFDNNQTPGRLDYINELKIDNFRSGLSSLGQDSPLVNNLRWDMKINLPSDQLYFVNCVRKAWDMLQEYQPPFRSKEWAPLSPNVIPFSIDEVRAMDELRINWKDFIPSKHPSQKLIEETKKKIELHIKTKKTSLVIIPFIAAFSCITTVNAKPTVTILIGQKNRLPR